MFGRWCPILLACVLVLAGLGLARPAAAGRDSELVHPDLLARGALAVKRAKSFRQAARLAVPDEPLFARSQVTPTDVPRRVEDVRTDQAGPSQGVRPIERPSARGPPRS